MIINGHKILFKAIVGSHACGTNIETSDIDYKGVFIQDPKDAYLNGYKDELVINKDEKYFEIEKFLNMCASGNPDALLLLFSPENCIIWTTEVFNGILNIKNTFLTKNLRHSFGEYAIAQIRKSSGKDKKMNWEKEKIKRATVEEMCLVYDFSFIYNENDMFNTNGIKYKEWLKINNFDAENCGLSKLEHFRDCYLLFHSTSHKYKGISTGEDANDVCLSKIELGAKPIAILFFNKDAYSINCKKWNLYEKWLVDRNNDRYVEIEGHNQKIDGKNVLHCVRIIETAMEIPIYNKINVYRENKEFLIGIRKGKYDLQSLIDISEDNLQKMDKLFLESNLPDKYTNKKELYELLSMMREKNYEGTL